MGMSMRQVTRPPAIRILGLGGGARQSELMGGGVFSAPGQRIVQAPGHPRAVTPAPLVSLGDS